jgi:mRNA interferase MazF
MQCGDVAAIVDRAEGDYVSKPHAAVVVQSDMFLGTRPVMVALLTTAAVVAPLLRLQVEPPETLPLQQTRFVMADKITTISRSIAEQVIGRLSREDLVRLDRPLVVLLGIG